MARPNKAKEWIKQVRSKGASIEEIIKMLREVGYPEHVISTLIAEEKNLVKEIEKGADRKIFKLGAVIVICIVLFLSINFFVKDITSKELINVTSNSNVNRILAPHIDNLWQKADCPVPKEKSLVNLIHIRESKEGVDISCEFGDSYDSAKLNLLAPGEVAHMAQILNCDKQTGEIIHEIIKKKEFDCRVPISQSGNIPIINDYYIFLITCRIREVTPHWINYTKNIPCWENLDSIEGEKIAMVHLSGIIDPVLGTVLI